MNKLMILAVFSPFFILYPIAEIEVLARKELFIFCVFMATLLYIIFTSTDDEQDNIILQATTSTDNSGFFSYILPLFEQDTSIRVDVVAVGTGQAIKNAKNGDGDLLLVHEKELEEQFVADGYGSKRFDLMFNDFERRNRFLWILLSPPCKKVRDSHTCFYFSREITK